MKNNTDKKNNREKKITGRASFCFDSNTTLKEAVTAFYESSEEFVESMPPIQQKTALRAILTEIATSDLLGEDTIEIKSLKESLEYCGIFLK